MHNTLLYAAAVFAVVVSLVHSLLGERRLIGPLVDGSAPGTAILRSTLARRVLRFAWHITSLSWCAQAAIFVIAARAAPQIQGRAIAGVIGASFLVMAVIGCAMSRGRFIGWPFLGATALAGLAAMLAW